MRQQLNVVLQVVLGIILLLTSNIGHAAIFKCLINNSVKFQQNPCPPGTSLDDNTSSISKKDKIIKKRVNEMLRQAGSIRLDLAQNISEGVFDTPLSIKLSKWGAFKTENDTVTIEFDPVKLGVSRKETDEDGNNILLNLIFKAQVQNDQIRWFCFVKSNGVDHEKYTPGYCKVPE